MTWLRVFDENNPQKCEHLWDLPGICAQVARANIVLERWEAGTQMATDAAPEEVLKTYDLQVKKLMADRNYASADVISVNPNTPNHPELRKKFLDEHTHSEDEARFFVEGAGLFYIHAAGCVFALMCERGDLIVVPAGTKHWFDMGPRPSLKVIRTFTTPEGWVADFTGSDIASRFPRFENLVPALA